MTDADFMASVLSDGDWHSRDEILERSMRDRGCGLTPHSRAAELRKRGLTVLCRTHRNDRGRTVSLYRLAGVLEEPVVSDPASRDNDDPSTSLSSTGSSSTPIPAASHSRSDHPASRGGVLELFPSTVETVGRGAYTEEVA